MTGLYLNADKQSIYRTRRTPLRSAKMQRLPCLLLLSRLKGASPASAAIFWRSSWPNSGISATTVAAMITPTPGILSRSSACSFHSGKRSSSSWIWISSSRILVPICSIWSRKSAFRLSWTIPKRFYSAVRISTSCSHCVTSALRRISFSSLGVYAFGWILKAYSAIKRASITSVLASLPVALANASARVGLMTATGRSFISIARTTGCSFPAVASTAISCAPVPLIRSMISPAPFSSLFTYQAEPNPHVATSCQLLPMSIPMCPSPAIVISVLPPVMRGSPILAKIRPLSASQLFGRSDSRNMAVTL